MSNDLEAGFTMPDGSIILNPVQARKLGELLERHVDLDVVSLDNDDPEGALFVEALIGAIRAKAGVAQVTVDQP
jgi:hypothetical protein